MLDLNLVWSGKRFRLAPGVLFVGRDPSCDIVVDVPNVSRRHALFRVRQHQLVTIEDLGSTNGVYVNAELIEGPTRVMPSDSITIGSQTFVVEAEASRAVPTREMLTLAEGSDLQSTLIEASIAKRNFDEAAQLVEQRMSAIRQSLLGGATVHRHVLERSFDHVLWLAKHRREARCMAELFDIYRAATATMPARQIDVLHIAVLHARELRSAAARLAIEAYVGALSSRRESLSAAERFSLSRTESLLRAMTS